MHRDIVRGVGGGFYGGGGFSDMDSQWEAAVVILFSCTYVFLF